MLMKYIERCKHELLLFKHTASGSTLDLFQCLLMFKGKHLH